MHYYAQIDNDYCVVNLHSLTESSTNESYISITEDQYTNGELVGKYYNSLTGNFEKIDIMENYTGNTDGVTCMASGVETQMMLTTKIDNMQVEIGSKADISHTHTEYASSDDLQLLEDVVDTKANANHSHTEYASASHSHSNYATTTSLNELSDVVSDKANATDLASHTGNTAIHVTQSDKNIWNAKSDFSGNYNDLTNKPSIPSIDGLATETYVDTQIDAIDIPNALSDLTTDSTHRVVTDTEKATWNAKSDFSGSYNDLTDKPSIPSISGLATETYVDEAVSTKADSGHNHNNVYYTETEVNSLLSGKASSTHNHDSSYDASGSAANALSSANAYTDTEIDALSETVATKANTSDLTSHTGNTTVHITSTERNNWNAAKTHANSAHAPSNAEENQNAFSNIVIGSTTISADTKTDTLTLVAGNNVTLTPDSTGDSVTISSANTVYTHPTTAGNKHIPAGGSSGQILRWSADGTAVWGNDNNTTYSNATQTTSGLMSDTDKTKLDGIAVGANNYTLPSAGTSLGGVKSGGDVTISSGVITVNDDSHNHIISNVDGLQSALDAKADSGHSHNDTYYTETEVNTLLSGKANTSHGTHVSYSTTAPVMDGTASVGTASTVARSDHKHPTDTSRAAQADLTSHTSNKSNPHGVTLAQLGVTATAAELNALDGITATVTELNYMDGVTSNVQTQLNGKAASSHGTHVTYGTTAPKANGTAAVGTASTVSRSDHIHPLQTTVSGNAGTATKLATARTISLTGDVTGSTSFDGSGNVSITATVADDSHNHTIANVDGLQTALDGKSATSHNHNSAYISKNLQFTGDNGSAIISYNRDDGKNILTEIAALPAGFYTIYSQSGTSGNPKTTEAWRFMVHKTGATAGWVQGYGSIGSVYTNYIDGTNGWRGWRCIWDNDPNPLWSGQYYMSSPNSTPQTVTPSKKLSECRTGWLLLWSDYDAGSGSNDSDFVTTVIPKNNPSGGTWGGKSFLCDIPRYVGSNAEDVDTERRIIKPIYVHDDCIKGSYQNDKDERNDVVLRAVYEI